MNIMSPKYICCIVLLISASKISSGETLETELTDGIYSSKIVDKFTIWLKHAVNKLNSDMKAAEKRLMDRYHKLISNGKSEISHEVSEAKEFLEPLSLFGDRKCVAVARSQLDAIHERSVAEFKTCANLSDIFDNIKEILKRTEALGELMFDALDDWIHWITGCLPVFSAKDVKCIIDAVFKIFDSFHQIVKACEVYGENVTSLGHKITAEIHACRHPSNGVTNQVEKVMAQLQTCSKFNFVY